MCKLLLSFSQVSFSPVSILSVDYGYTIKLLLTNCEVHTGNIRTAVLKYGPNEVRFVRKTKVRIFSRMDQTNWSIRALLYSHNINQRPKPSSNSTMNIFVFSPVSSLNAVVGK